MANDTVNLRIEFPKDLRERARVAAKAMGTSTKGLVCMALDKMLDEIEAKQRQETDRKRQEREDKYTKRRPSAMSISLAPKLPDAFAPTPVVPPSKERLDLDYKDPVDAVYIKHAKLIMEVLENPEPTEKRIRIGEALAAIKKQAPLTHPSDKEITENLERVIIELRTREPKTLSLLSDTVIVRKPPSAIETATRMLDRLVGQVVGENIPTQGDVGEEEKDE